MYNGYKLFRGSLSCQFSLHSSGHFFFEKSHQRLSHNNKRNGHQNHQNTQHQPGRQPLTKNHDTKEESRHRFECSQDSGRRGANGARRLQPNSKEAQEVKAQLASPNKNSNGLYKWKDRTAGHKRSTWPLTSTSGWND